MKLPSGKIPLNILEEVIFRNLGAIRREVALGPATGIDGAVIDVGDHSLVVSMDPVTGALENVGWIAVNVNANDIATFGVEPAFLFSCILLPKTASRKTVETISSRMNEASKKLNIAIVGGHCEVTPGLVNPIVVGCAMGITGKGCYVTSGGAKTGDTLILTKSAGIEGAAILASDREEQLREKMNAERLESAKGFFNQISVVKEATTAFRSGGVDAMHDPTEGGIIGGISEMAEASKLGVEVYEREIPVQPETVEICKFFNVNPLRLISSGALLIAARPRRADKIIENLKQQSIHASIIGQFHKDPNNRVLITKNKKTQPLPMPAPDHLWRALAKK